MGGSTATGFGVFAGGAAGFEAVDFSALEVQGTLGSFAGRFAGTLCRTNVFAAFLPRAPAALEVAAATAVDGFVLIFAGLGAPLDCCAAVAAVATRAILGGVVFFPQASWDP